MADDWAGLSAQLGKMQQIWYVTQRSYWNVFDPNTDTATIMAEDGSTRQVPSWRGITNTLSRAVSLDTEQTITAIKTYTARIASAPPGDGWGTWTGDRWPSLQLSCPDTARAYMVWRATEWGNRHLAALDVHGGGGAKTTPYVSLHIAGLYNAHVWKGGDYTAAGVVNVGIFTRATLPAANSSPSGIAYISDGPNGPTHVFSNGQKWRVPTMTDL
ncbi:Peptidase S74 domain-containing protein [Chromobacterium violaceum]|uniref:hypothetical protein n=1 Tax=Chromobacterium violaceum TaxID=536 RepID=UPI003CF1CC6F